MAEFKVGDVVQLKSGGPEMTVTGPANSGNVLCAWFTSFDAASISTGVFPPAALKTPAS